MAVSMVAPEVVELRDVDATLHGAEFPIDDIVSTGDRLVLIGSVEGAFGDGRYAYRRRVCIEALNVQEVRIDDAVQIGVVFLDDFVMEGGQEWRITDPTFGGIYVRSPLADLQFTWDTQAFEYRHWWRWRPYPPSGRGG